MLERLKQLEINVSELESFKAKFNVNEIKEDIQKEWVLRYGLLESIQIVIDISCYLANKINLGNPQTYSECVELLKKHGYIHPELSEKLIGMIGLRNLLVHEYISIDIVKLYSLLGNLNDFSNFAKAVKNVI